MKHLILVLFVLLSCSVNTSAQEANGKSYYYYCSIATSPKKGGYLAEVATSDMGARTICDENNKPVIFKTTVGALTHMSKAGWEYVDRSIVQGYFTAIFRKKVTKDEEATQGLNLLTEDEIKKAGN